MTSVLEANSIEIGYHSSLVSPFDIKLRKGSLVALLGPNGSGKTSLIKTLAGIIPPYSGMVKFLGKDLKDFSLLEKSHGITTVFMNQSIHPQIKVKDYVSLGRSPYSNFLDARRETDLKIVNQALEETRTLHFEDRFLSTLSDGERSRVFLARALAQEVQVLFLDEPFAFLDIPNTVYLFNLLKKLTQETGLSILLSSHQLHYIKDYCDEVIAFDGRNKVFQKSVEDAFEGELLAWTKDFEAFL